MFSTTGVLARGLAAIQGTEAEKKLSELLYDDNIQVISSLELNQMASYTYHETSIAGGKDLCEKLLDMLEAVLSKPVDHSTLTVQKSLVVLKHLLIYGAEKVINASMYLGAYVEALQNYNTAVLAQQGYMGVLMQLKGGSVDKGGPVRELAQQLCNLISNRQALQFERSTKADPNSLVPIGSRTQAAFVTDEARLHALKKRMEQERAMLVKSNLAKSNSAFGSGYTGKDGKAIVGAAHGLEEMIKQAQKEKKKFSDEGYIPPGNEDAALAAAQAEANLQDLLAMANSAPSVTQPTSTAQSVDLLDFGATNMTTTSNNYQADLLGSGDWATSATTAPQTNDIFSGMATPAPAGVASDPFAFAIPAPAPANLPGLGGIPTAPAPAASKPAMSAQTDRFSALDALADSSSNLPPTLGGTLGSSGANLPSPDLSRLMDLSTLTISSPPAAAMPTVDTSSLKVSQMGNAPIGGSTNGDDEDNPFVMGGAVGAGLTPLGPAPAAPPPPPPPGGW